MSQKTGSSPFRRIACVVEAKVKGVVMTSPFSPMACSVSSIAMCPFVNRSIRSTPRYSRSAFASSACFGPMLVSQWLSQIGRISSMYSSKSGMEERVTRICFITGNLRYSPASMLSLFFRYFFSMESR